MKKLYTILILSGILASCAPQHVCPTYSNAGPKKHHHASHHPYYKGHK